MTKEKKIHMTIRNPEGQIKIRTNSTDHAIAIGNAFNEACQKIAAEKMTLSEMERELNPELKFKQKSLFDFTKKEESD